MKQADEKPPREFWIDLSDAHDGDLPVAFPEHPRQGPLLWQSNLLHVIEYTALEQLKAENQKLRQELSAARKDLQFYALKLNYSIVDEGRNYSTELVCYELNEENYADVELGTRARQAIERIDKVLKPTQCDNNKL
jgi:hypothetical protein